jgi:hypothetical protein
VKIYQEKFKKYKRLRQLMLDEVRSN